MTLRSIVQLRIASALTTMPLLLSFFQQLAFENDNFYEKYHHLVVIVSSNIRHGRSTPH
jgi:hypothetical protein